MFAGVTKVMDKDMVDEKDILNKGKHVEMKNTTEIVTYTQLSRIIFL